MSRRREIPLRELDYESTLIDVDLQLDENVQNQMDETEDFTRKVATMKDLRRRINTLIKFIKDSSPAYYEAGVRETTQEERDDRKMHLFGATEDLVYKGRIIALIIHG